MDNFASKETAAKKYANPLAYYPRMLSSAAIMVAAWGMLLLLVWNLDRGVDLTDEANLLYNYRHPDALLNLSYQQHFRIVRALVAPAFDNIYYYRLLKLIALIGLTGTFSALFIKWIDLRIGFINSFALSPIVLFHFLLVGAFLAYCHGSQTLSYNDLVTLCLLAIAAACFALDLVPFNINVFLWKFIVSSLIGAVIALVVPIKWPCAPLLTGYFLLFITLVSSDRSRSALIASFCGATFGAALFIFATSDIGIGTIISYSDLFRAMLTPDNFAHHTPSELIKMYPLSIYRRILELFQFPSTLAALMLPFVIAVVSAVSNGRAEWGLLRGGLIISSIAFFSIFVSETPDWAWHHVYYFHRYNIADLQTFTFVFAWIAACCYFFLKKNVIPKHEAIILIRLALLLAALPAVGSIGTNNPLLTQFIRHMGPLFAALAVTAAFLGLAARWRSFAAVVCAAIASLSAAQFAFVLLYYPYRLAAPGVSQTVALTEPKHMTGLKVDAQTHTFIDRLLTEARRVVGDTTGTPMLALFDIPGVVYILDGVSVGSSWHGTFDSEGATCQRIQSDPLSRTGLRLVVFDRDEISASLRECIGKAGIDLSKYQERARIEIPNDVLSKSNGRSLRLLKPKM